MTNLLFFVIIKLVAISKLYAKAQVNCIISLYNLILKSIKSFRHNIKLHYPLDRQLDGEGNNSVTSTKTAKTIIPLLRLGYEPQTFTSARSHITDSTIKTYGHVH
jgi:hypothetical protein